jgi:hypothetical protein
MPKPWHFSAPCLLFILLEAGQPMANQHEYTHRCRDSQCIIHAVQATAANMHDLKTAPDLLQIYGLLDSLNQAEGRISYHVDHIQPLAAGSLHHPDNLRVLAAFEHMRKGAKLPDAATG